MVSVEQTPTLSKNSMYKPNKFTHCILYKYMYVEKHEFPSHDTKDVIDAPTQTRERFQSV